MTFTNSVYRLYEEISNGIGKCFISFRDSAGVFQTLEVSETFYIEFRQMERKTQNMRQSEWRHNEHLELTEQSLHRRAMVYPKSVEDTVLEMERSEKLQCAIDKLPEIQKRRFLLYFDKGYNFREIAEMEGRSKTAMLKSAYIAREKIREAMEKYLCS